MDSLTCNHNTQQMPLSSRQSFARGMPRSSFGDIGLIAPHFQFRGVVAHDSKPRLGGLHRGPVATVDIAAFVGARVFDVRSVKIRKYLLVPALTGGDPRRAIASFAIRAAAGARLGYFLNLLGKSSAL